MPVLATDGLRHIPLCDKCEHEFVLRPPHPPVALEALRQKDYPSSAERAQTVAILEEEEAELKRYDEVLERQQRIVDSLRKEREVLNRRIEGRRGWFAPIRRIPAEILGLVLEYVCLSEEYSLSIQDKARTVLAPSYILSRVSAHWRRLVTSSPHLWASISVDFYRPKRNVCDLIRLYYTNFRELPLKMSFFDQKKVFGEDPSSTLSDYLRGVGEEVFLVLLEGLPRCEALRMNFEEDLFNAIEPSNRSHISFPLLRSFTDVLSYGTVPGAPWFWREVRQAQNLTEIAVHYYWRITSVETYPVGRLTSLRLEQADRSLAINTIGYCPNLDSLVIQQVINRDRPLNMRTPSVSSRLRYLCITGNGCLDLPWEVLTFLLLESLHFDNSSIHAKTYQWNDTFFIDMLRRSSCPLKHLTLLDHGCTIPAAFITQVLSLTPQLRSLELSVKGSQGMFTSHLLSCLEVPETGSINSNVLVPSLEDLSIYELSGPTSMDSGSDTIHRILTSLESRSIATMNQGVLVTPIVLFDCLLGNQWAQMIDCTECFPDRVRVLAQRGTKCDISWNVSDPEAVTPVIETSSNEDTGGENDES